MYRCIVSQTDALLWQLTALCFPSYGLLAHGPNQSKLTMGFYSTTTNMYINSINDPLNLLANLTLIFLTLQTSITKSVPCVSYVAGKSLQNQWGISIIINVKDWTYLLFVSHAYGLSL